MNWKPLVRALANKQTIMALTTIATSVGAAYGLEWDSSAVAAIVGAGVAVMVALAGRDARKKRKSNLTGDKTAPPKGRP